MRIELYNKQCKKVAAREIHTRKISITDEIKNRDVKNRCFVEGLDVKKLERFLNDEYNFDVRAGDLTAQPLMKILGVKALIRPSPCYYNTSQEVDVLAGAVEEFIRKNG